MSNVLSLCLSELTWSEAYRLGDMSRSGMISVSAGSPGNLRVNLLKVSSRYFYLYLSGKRSIDSEPVIMKRREEWIPPAIYPEELNSRILFVRR